MNDGAFTQLAGVLPIPSSGDLEFDSSGNLYMSGFGSDRSGDRLVEVTVTSSTVSGSTIDWFGVHEMHGLAYVDDTLYGFSGQNAYRIDLSSGDATDSGTLSGMDANTVVYGASTDPTQVPEPTSAALAISASMTLAGIRLGKKKSSGNR